MIKVATQISPELKERLDQEASERRISLHRLLAEKIAYACTREDNDKLKNAVQDLILQFQDMTKVVRDRQDTNRITRDLCVHTISMIADYIRATQGNDQYLEIFNEANRKLKRYKETGQLSI